MALTERMFSPLGLSSVSQELMKEKKKAFHEISGKTLES